MSRPPCPTIRAVDGKADLGMELWICGFMAMTAIAMSGVFKGAEGQDWAWLLGGGLTSFLIVAVSGYLLRRQIRHTSPTWMRVAAKTFLFLLTFSLVIAYIALADDVHHKARDIPGFIYCLPLLPLLTYAAGPKKDSRARKRVS